jgi:Uma2 family endonuclease
MYWKKGGRAMAPAPPLMTVDEYFSDTPETVKPMELIFGALRVADSPLPPHQMAVADLFRALDAHVREREIGQVWLSPLDVVLDEEQALIVQPDLFFVSNERAWIVSDRVRGAPDLVVEVLSPNPRIGTTTERVGWFAQYGVRECWLLHQAQVSVDVMRFANRRIVSTAAFGRRERILSAVLPDFALTLDDVLKAYPDPPPGGTTLRFR